MNLPDIPLFSMLRERMAWLNQRQGVLSENVANADTPGFVARDLKPLDFSQQLQSAGESKVTGLTVTNPRHIAVKSSTASGDFQATDTPDVEANPNGNAVSLEQEMIKVSDTQMQFQAAANLYGKAMSLMKTAIGQP
ncbi:MAG TPA: flagellar basal body rod protein FlgB [Rhizomicrobium sp.]|jgi:flagellar basal-body rod protein FlgB|nr:flagellar basal body rod protein FlgB [Rhizomicrobium sp.]